MSDLSPHNSYQKELEKYRAALARLEKRRSQLGWLRLAVFVITVIAAYQFFTTAGLWGLVPTVLGIGILLYLVTLDVANHALIRNTKTLIRVNEEELQVLAHRYFDREDGSRFTPQEHPYANDLDIFGKASIYQWLSRCYTEQGKTALANNLLQPVPLEKILHRQAAVKELATNLSWRQQWQAYAMQTAVTLAAQQKMEIWLQEEEEQFTSPAWNVIIPVYSLLTIASAIAAILDYIPGAVFSMLFLLYLVISQLLSRKTILTYVHLGGIVKEASTLQALINWLEGLRVEAVHVKMLQQEIKSNTGFAGNELNQLKRILDRFDIRNNIVGLLFFNSFLLWDVRQMRALNTWRRRNKDVVQKWFAAIAEMEVLHSISTLQFNQSLWCFPTFTEQHFTFDGKQVGHPLIPESSRVNNDFNMQGVAKVGLITGSNMAGKSTFLRSLGVNIVLAQVGAPVCAKSFSLSPVQLLSSMRIADNLAENTSTFYAELKKLRTIIERVKRHEKVFILLDEILRGTNSYDRHTGAAALLKQLIKEKAVAVIATHDVELAGLQSDYPHSVENYHFDVEVEGEELYFDYRLKHGVCKSLNASILMKKIGIDL
ncbi:MAG: MutS family DNA mismatch repair protein [Bacteroidota bacterium]|nr:MutS family DNA mismatch repair protein [Bacteroidota bacterium]